jgi:hypothetical protein
MNLYIRLVVKLLYYFACQLQTFVVKIPLQENELIIAPVHLHEMSVCFKMTDYFTCDAVLFPKLL